MSGLALYNGNFLSFADNEFGFDGGYTWSGLDITELDISVSCPVGIFRSHTDQTIVEVDTDSVEDFEVYQQGSTFVVRQNSQGGSVNMINGVTFVGGNVSMVNGEVWINGQRVDMDQSQQSSYPHKIRIFAPSGIDLEASLEGVGTLASKIVFDNANIEVSGQSAVGVAARSLNLDVSGQGQNYAVLQGGSLKVDVSGQGKVRVKGEYSDANVSVSGMGSINTDGNCNGNYRASVSGMGSISHHGAIAGRIKKSVSGMGSINI